MSTCGPGKFEEHDAQGPQIHFHAIAFALEDLKGSDHCPLCPVKSPPAQKETPSINLLGPNQESKAIKQLWKILQRKNMTYQVSYQVQLPSNSKQLQICYMYPNNPYPLGWPNPTWSRSRRPLEPCSEVCPPPCRCGSPTHPASWTPRGATSNRRDTQPFHVANHDAFCNKRNVGVQRCWK